MPLLGEYLKDVKGSLYMKTRDFKSKGTKDHKKVTIKITAGGVETKMVSPLFSEPDMDPTIK